MKVLVLDNYDSFTYNLVHLLLELGVPRPDLHVRRNDKITLDEVGQYDKILLSPGPGLPSEAGIMPELITRYAPQKSILGICLGHQAIAEAFGGQLYNLPEVLHGVSTEAHITDPDEGLFSGLPATFSVGRYHSWAVRTSPLPGALEITATDEQGIILGLRHHSYDVHGLQFHPESVLTPQGGAIVRNWLQTTPPAYPSDDFLTDFLLK